MARISGIYKRATQHGYLVRKFRDISAYVLYDPLTGEGWVGSLTEVEEWLSARISDPSINQQCAARRRELDHRKGLRSVQKNWASNPVLGLHASNKRYRYTGEMRKRVESGQL